MDERNPNNGLLGELPDDIQRWTAKRRAALVLAILRRETLVKEARATSLPLLPVPPLPRDPDAWPGWLELSHDPGMRYRAVLVPALDLLPPADSTEQARILEPLSRFTGHRVPWVARGAPTGCTPASAGCRPSPDCSCAPGDPG